MKRMNLWMIVAILFCGLTFAACATDDNKDNATQPDTKALNSLLAGRWYDEYESDWSVYDEDNKLIEQKDGRTITTIRFNVDGTGSYCSYFFSDEDHDEAMELRVAYDKEDGSFHYTSTADGNIVIRLDHQGSLYFPDELALSFDKANGTLTYEGGGLISPSRRAASTRTLTHADEEVEALFDQWSTKQDDPATPDDLSGVTYDVIDKGISWIGSIAYQVFRSNPEDDMTALLKSVYTGPIEEPEAEANSRRAYGIKVPTNYYRWYKIQYQSIDDDGNPITLSARVSWGGRRLFSLGSFYEVRPNYIILNPHFTITNQSSSPYSGNAYEIPFMSGCLLLIQPDYQGFGITAGEKHQAYINHEVCARQCIDALKAGYKLFADVANVKMEYNWKLYVAGCSQGGGNSLACHKWLDTHEDFAKSWRFAYSYCGSGPHSPSVTFNEYFKQEVITYPVVFPIVIKSMMHVKDANGENILKDYKEEDFFSDKYNQYKKEIDEMVTSKLYGAGQINKFIFEHFPTTKHAKTGATAVALKELLSPEAMNKESEMCKKLFECFDKNDLTKGWTPTRPIYLFHGEGDTVVPYANSEAVKEAFPDKVTLYSSTKLWGADDHLPSCVQFLLHVATANW
ncbi:MAG: hypothetical protein IJG07_08985 [Prevotella sp.]|nr:hypothetical protein [Prevotella sp.]MBR1412650.1 hypothetical protein [Prevotella sp.]